METVHPLAFVLKTYEIFCCNTSKVRSICSLKDFSREDTHLLRLSVFFFLSPFSPHSGISEFIKIHFLVGVIPSSESFFLWQ